ncbi:aspartyl protease family protein [Segetibacter koreensis]|uniref:aspartyl protease family protein n=1 Tax=Segetibacter koreensis TaxID=398037 RepID=UPI0003A857CD|nr:aspartyl protease family protein [Segetibacter koreensis]
MTQRLTNKNSIACLIQFLLVLILFTGSEVASGQNDNAPSSTLITRFPFTTLSGGIIIIQLRLDDFPDTLNFILDTGSGGVSLDSTTVSYFRLPITPSERRLRGIGSMRKISYVMNRTLHLPNLDVEHLDIHINDYELLTSVYGVRIDGIIGYSFLSRYIVKIDYDNNVVEVWNQGKIKYPKSGILLNPIINGIPVFDASVIDNTSISSRFYFDTGAGLCLLMSEAFEQDSSILSKGKKIILTQAEGLGGKTQMKLTTVKQIKIGKYKFKKVPAHIFKDEYNVTAYPSLGGLIGNDLLRRFNLILNYSEKEIHLKPNSHFKESFDYSYTGLGIYVENNQVIIEDVLKDSPGEKAGLIPGDVIMGIDNNVSGNIQAYKNILQDVGARVRILVVRNGELLVKHLKVASIL